jgi:ribonuclease P protein component
MLNKKNRLTKRGSFSYVYKSGQQRDAKAIKLCFVKSRGVRVGFSVGAKIGKAHIRNLVKRRLRAAVRELLPDITTGCQAVVLARPAAAELTYLEIKRDLRFLFSKAGLMGGSAGRGDA